MSHKCVLCNKALIETKVLMLKTIAIICIDCVEKCKAVKETPAKAPKKLFLKIDPKVAHLAVRAGVLHDGSGFYCLAEHASKFTEYVTPDKTEGTVESSGPPLATARVVVPRS